MKSLLQVHRLEKNDLSTVITFCRRDNVVYRNESGMSEATGLTHAADQADRFISLTRPSRLRSDFAYIASTFFLRVNANRLRLMRLFFT